jgi:hypothetical protein
MSNMRDLIMSLATGGSQWLAEINAQKANQGIFGGLGSLYTGNPYNPNASIQNQIGGLTDSTLQQLGWGTGQIKGTLSDLGGIQANAKNAFLNNSVADMLGLNNLDRSMQQSLGAYGTSMQGAANKYGQAIENAYSKPYANAMGYANQMGAQQQRDIRQNYANLNAQTAQNLAQSGLGNTSVGSSMRAGNTRLQQADLNSLAESLAGQKIGIESSLGSQLAGAKAQGAQTQFGVNTDLASQNRQLSDWYSNAFNQMGSQARWGESGLNEQQARETLDTKTGLMGGMQNLIYSPNVGAADQSTMYNAAQGYGYASVPPYQPNNWLGMGGAGMQMAALPLMATNAAAPGLGFGLGMGLYGAGTMMQYR